MAPLVPRMHLFEIDDQPWFPPFLRARVQAALTVAWTTHVPLLQACSPAALVSRILTSNLASTVRSYVFIDFCAGGGGPTPSIEAHLNRSLTSSTPSPTSDTTPVQFVLTDLHPHIASWKRASSRSPNLSYIPHPVDAAHAPVDLVGRYKDEGKKVFRLFNLAFHHFDDELARAILKNTVETSDGFGIFELQERSFLGGFVTLILFGLGILLAAPYYAVKWRSPGTLFFTYLVPILPAVLVFDGWMSALRTRTVEEVEELLRTCAAEGGEEEIRKWEVRSGRAAFMWPVGYLNWIVCVRREE